MACYLVDTNVLIRVINRADASHQVADAAISTLVTRGEQLVLVPQCLYEFYVVATRPVGVNGLGMSRQEAQRDVSEFCQKFRLFEDESGLYAAWSDVITTYQPLGKPAHDARLVAAMRLHNIPQLLTFNLADFQRYIPEITLIDPADV